VWGSEVRRLVWKLKFWERLKDNAGKWKESRHDHGKEEFCEFQVDCERSFGLCLTCIIGSVEML
jgi:hypothetical protein